MTKQTKDNVVMAVKFECTTIEEFDFAAELVGKWKEYKDFRSNKKDVQEIST